MVALSDLSLVTNGKTPGKTEKRTEGHPVLKIRDVDELGRFRGIGDSFVEPKFASKFRSKWVVPGDTLVLNAAHNADYVGSKSFYVTEAAAGTLATGEWLIVRPTRTRLDPRFAHFWLTGESAKVTIKDMVKGIHLYPKDIARLKIPLPDLPEQQRISGILDQADVLRHLRRQSLSRLSDLGKAIFFEMFGETNQENSAAFNATVGDVCSVSSGATPSRKVEGYYGGSIPWVKTTEVKGGAISRVGEYLTESGRAAARLKMYPPNTILVAMYGQGRTRGNVGYLTFSATVNQACAALQCNERCLPEFMFFQLKNSYERLRRLGQGGNQPNLNGEIVRSFPIVLPSRERQKAFLKVFEEIRDAEDQMTSHEKQANALFNSLQHRAFRGDL